MELSEESTVNQEKKERESKKGIENTPACRLVSLFLGLSLSYSPLFPSVFTVGQV